MMNMEEIGNYGHISACRITKRRDFMNYCYIKLRKFPVVEFVNFCLARPHTARPVPDVPKAG